MSIKINNIYEWISLNNGDEFLTIILWEDTPLRKTQYIKVNTVREIIDNKIPLKILPNLFVWDLREDGKQRYFKWDNDNSDMSLEDIIKTDINMQKFCAEFYPELLL